MGKSFDPMLKEKAGSGSRAHSRRSSASMSLQSAIPRRVALQQRTPLLHRLQSACDRLTLPVNRYGNDGNIAEPVNFNRPPEPPGGQTENRDFHLGIAENCPNNRDHRSLSRPEQVVYFFRQVLGIPVVSKEVLSQRTNDYRSWVEAYARNQGIAMEWAEKGVRKEDYVLPALRRMEKRNVYGVYSIFKSMEQGRTFRISVPKFPTEDPNYRILAHQ